MSIVIKAPEDFTSYLDKPSVFLAGSIEMGEAEKWQTQIENELSDFDVLILNPRRTDWDSTWKQEIDNPQFREQVEWELEAQEKASLIAMYFDKDSKSPITLLELGLFCDPKKLVVCCPEGFWRKGNVDIVCTRYGITQVDTLEELINTIQDTLIGRNNYKILTSQLSIENLARDINKKDEWEDPFKKLKKEERDKGLNPSVYEMANESYQDVNQFEDVRMHMGRFIAMTLRNIKSNGEAEQISCVMNELGFDKDESAGQIDTVIDENEQTIIPRVPTDMSIPRR